MFDVITKQEYWHWLQEDARPPSNQSAGRAVSKLAGLLSRASTRLSYLVAPPRSFEIKDVQDAFIYHNLHNIAGAHILEVGGGNPRLLKRLSRTNECWLIDKYEGVGGGPKKTPRDCRIKLVVGYVGEFNPALPEEYFDTLFSVSVLEHVPLNRLEQFFSDCARLLKPGGRMLHAIDIYVFDPGCEDLCAPFRQRLRAYLAIAQREDLGIRLLQPARVDENLSFSCSYASLPDNVMRGWQLKRPDDKRVHGQLVSLKTEWVKS